MSGCSSCPQVDTVFGAGLDFLRVSSFCFCPSVLNLLRLGAFFRLRTHKLTWEGHRNLPWESLLPIRSRHGHQHCSSVPIKEGYLPAGKPWMCKDSKILLAMCLLRPAKYPAMKLHRTDTFHLCLCFLFHVPLPKHLLQKPESQLLPWPPKLYCCPSTVRCWTVDHCRAILDLFVLFFLLCCSKILLWLSCPGLSPSTHLNDDRIFQSRCNILRSLFLHLLRSLFLLCSLSAPSTLSRFGQQ